jgi:hypothetical protein
MAKQHISQEFINRTNQVWGLNQFDLDDSFHSESVVENAVGFYSLLMEWDKPDE